MEKLSNMLYMIDLLNAGNTYSWKDDEWKNKNGKIKYTDTLGFFDLNRKKY